MNGMPNTSEDATDNFLRRIITIVYDGVIKVMQDLLEKGPPGRVKKPEKLKLYEWYQKLDQNDKQMVLAVIDQSVRGAIFSFLVELDNRSGGQPIKDEISDIAVYYQTYESVTDLYKYNPKSLIRINMSYSINGELHDLFMNLLNQLENDNNKDK